MSRGGVPTRFFGVWPRSEGKYDEFADVGVLLVAVKLAEVG